MGNIAFSSLALYVSSHNYPGAFALSSFHSLVPSPASVSIGDMAASTGITKFMYLTHYSYFKGNDGEGREYAIGEKEYREGYDLVHPVQAFHHIAKNPPGIEFTPTLFLHKHKHPQNT